MALATSTMHTYQSGVNSFMDFCRYWRLASLPLSEQTLRRFVSSLAFRVAYKTIKVYLAGIQFWSIRSGSNLRLHNMPRLYYTLRGIRRWQGSRFAQPRRLPITVYHLRLINHRLSLMQFTNYERILYRTALSLAFFGLLRCSEYTSFSQHRYDPTVTLLASDVQFSQDSSIMYIYIKASKTDPFRSGCTIRVARLSSNLCPVTLMQQFLRVRPSIRGPLFLFNAQRFLTSRDIRALLQRCLPGLAGFNTHSLRIGGASAAAAAGIPDSQIQILGRWASDAYQRYIHLSDATVADVCTRMSRTSNRGQPWDPVNCFTA